VLDVLFDSTEYVASNPVPPGSANPHVLVASAAAVPIGLADAVIVLPPLVKLYVVSASASVSRYPAELFVLTVSVSLALVSTGLAPGVRFKSTLLLVPCEVVVNVIAAETIARTVGLTVTAVA
jgi:hypothetical protein